MTGRQPGGNDAVLGALRLVGDSPGVAAVLEATLDHLLGALGASSAAFYVDDPGGATFITRCRRPEEGGPQPGEVLVPTRIGGQPAGTLGLSMPPGKSLSEGDLAAAEGVAQAIALAVRNDDLVRGLGDRVRELDRQALHLDALTRVARRVAETLDEGDAQRIIVSEARQLAQADRAALLVQDSSGALRTAASQGPQGEDPDAAGLAIAVAEGGARRQGRSAAVAVPSRGSGAAGPASVIMVSRSRGPAFTDADLDRLGGLADQASVALANGRLLSGLRGEQAHRRSLASSIVLAQETERRRVAEDLHDGPVQELVGVGLLLDALSADLDGTSPGVVADVNRAAAAAREAVRALRRAISDLHPMSLEELGFAAAVRSLVERIEWRGARVLIDVAAVDGLSDTHRTLAFRIVQEAVANIVRHAEPQLVTITATEAEGAVTITIHDDGQGFDPSERRPGVADGHLGLAAAEERAALGGGRLTVESCRGAGTTLALTLPGGSGAAGQVGAAPPGNRASAVDRASESAKRSSTTT